MKAFSFNLYKDEKCTEKASDQIFTNDLSTGKIEFTVPFKQGQDYAFDMKDMTAQENGRTVYAVQELERQNSSCQRLCLLYPGECRKASGRILQ